MGIFCTDMAEDIAYFDMFFRKIPDDGGYAVMAGLEQVIRYLDGLEFTEEDIEYLRSKKIFNEDFLKYLEDFKFTCDVWAVPEGTPIFPGGTDNNGKRPGDAGSVRRDDDPPYNKSSESYSDKGQQDSACGGRKTCNGIQGREEPTELRRLSTVREQLT